MSDFVAKILDPSPKNRFLASFIPAAEEIARLGAINSLSQVVLKLTVPGVPDIYQGNEIWDFSLVDPDNRRPVDYEKRKKMLAAITTAEPEELLQNWPDGRIKLFLTQRLLHFRRDHASLFLSGSYLPLTVRGEFADCCVAFAREHEGKWIAVFAPRLSSRIGFPPTGERWKDTVVDLPAGFPGESARDIFTGRELRGDGSALKLSDAMATLPFAVATTLTDERHHPVREAGDVREKVGAESSESDLG
jgi:(1->4)-alpha-D-glucan 1-alpha-D-glucosylmutase